MSGLFKKPKPPEEKPIHSAVQFRERRAAIEENRTYNALDAALGLKPRRREMR
jgi:hypothetical protein